jgi:hypothetical protein
MPPFFDDAEVSRPYFAGLRRLGEDLAARLGRPMALSMGMTHDYAVAVAEGATIIRVGTAIFGERS